LNILGGLYIFAHKHKMYRYSDKTKGKGFVFGFRSAVKINNEGESYHDKYSHAYTQNALHSYKHEEQYNIKKNLENQQSQIQYRNLFNELPNFSGGFATFEVSSSVRSAPCPQL
jgi:hypothetical protein